MSGASLCANGATRLLYLQQGWRQAGVVAMQTVIKGFLEAGFKPMNSNNLNGFERDMFIPVEDCRAEQAMNPNSESPVIPPLRGHFVMMSVPVQDFEAINISCLMPGR